MKHLIKIPLENSDMFVSKASIEPNQLISYEIRDKITGKLMENKHKDIKFETKNNMIYFDNRHIALDYVMYFEQLLK